MSEVHNHSIYFICNRLRFTVIGSRLKRQVQGMKFKEYYLSLDKKRKVIFFLIAFLTFFSFIYTIATISFIGIRLFAIKREKLPIDEKIPEFSLKDEKGEMVNLTRGKPVKKLFLFFKPKCAACRMELANLQYLAKHLSRERIELFAISEVSEEETKKFLKVYAINFPVLIDPDKSLRKIFKFYGTPAFFLIDEEGVIKYGRVGYKKIAFDEMLIKEFLQSGKIPIEVFEPEQDEK